MNKAEIWDLFECIVIYYPTFSADSRKAEAWHEMMDKVPFDLTITNLKHHVATDKFPPTIAELIRPLDHPKSDAEKYNEFMRNAGIHTLEEWEQMRKRAVPPTPEQRERVKRYAGRI